MPPSVTQNTGLPYTTGRYTVVEKEGVSRSQWDGWVEDSPGGGHILQSHEWGELRRGMGWRPVRLLFEEDGQIAGVGQFLVYNTPLVPDTLMFCPKGPWLPWDNEEAVQAFFEGVLAVAEREGAHTVKIEPEVLEQQTRVKELLSEIGFHRLGRDFNYKTTILLDLSPSEDEILAGMKKKTRQNIRIAERKGVRVVEDNSPEALEALWKMFEQAAERNDFWHRPHDYQIAAWKALLETGKTRVLFAEHEGEWLAGALFHIMGNKCWYMSSASTNEKRNLKPTYPLQWEIMRWAKQQGITCYDMVTIPSPEHLDDESHPLHGVYKFKAGFGGKIADFVGCLDLPVKPVRAGLWSRIEPIYFRLYQRLKGDIYY